MVRSRFHQVERNIEHNIVFIEDDCGLYNGTVMSVTNDAENVVKWFRNIFGNRVRIVYKDTDNEWWEIVWSTGFSNGIFVSFKPWPGLAWDILSRKEQV
jgi:hypothetical protein